MDYSNQLKKLLDRTIDEKSSDLLISVNCYPAIRITGKLVPLTDEKRITKEDAKGLAFSLLEEDKKDKFLKEKEIDFSYDLGNKARFRVNIYFQRGSISLALRAISPNIKTIEELSLPAVLHEFTKKTQGLVLVTGASGQGKSTTLASLVDEINHTRAVH